jgi:RNA polymerase sigma factor (sigma-70 family)
MTAYTNVKQRKPAKGTVADLVGRAARGDRGAWETLVEEFAGVVWSAARAYRLSDADAADVFQATWVCLLEHIDDLQDPARLAGWLATTARRKAVRVANHNLRVLPTDEEPPVADGDGQGAETRLAAEELDAAIRQALTSLPERDQRLLELLVADPRPPYEEIARRLDMPIGSIGPTRARALERLRQAIRQAGMELEDIA